MDPMGLKIAETFHQKCWPGTGGLEPVGWTHTGPRVFDNDNWSEFFVEQNDVFSKTHPQILVLDISYEYLAVVSNLVCLVA